MQALSSINTGMTVIATTIAKTAQMVIAYRKKTSTFISDGIRISFIQHAVMEIPLSLHKKRDGAVSGAIPVINTSNTHYNNRYSL